MYLAFSDVLRLTWASGRNLIHHQTIMPSKDPKEEKKEKAREVVDILEEISLLLVSSVTEFARPPPPDYH
jgi:hypothetical protein